MKKINAFLVLSFVIILLALDFCYSYDYVVINSKDWRSIYLGIIFSVFDESKPLFFDDLSDVNLKTSMMNKNSSILVLESKIDPIIRNYESFLKVRKFRNVTVFYFADFTDLDIKLYKLIKNKVNDFIVFNPDFGNEAVVSAPLIKEQKLWPVFLTKNNLKQVISNFDFDRDSIAAGYFEPRLIDFFPGKKFIDTPYKNMINLLNYTLKNVKHDWAVLMILDKADPNVLISGRPIFIYYDNLDKLVDLVNDYDVVGFEVIGGELADVAKELETRSGKDLKLLLKYARTITNLKPYQGRLLDLDNFKIDYPFIELKILNVTFYPNLNTLTVTIKNTGNFRAFFYTNLEFLDKPFSNDFPYMIKPNQILTIPYYLNLSADEIKDAVNTVNKANLSVVLNILYGIDFPLEENLRDEKGLPLIHKHVDLSSYKENCSIDLLDYYFDNTNGKLILNIRNPNERSVYIFAEVYLNDDNISASRKIKLGSHEKGNLVVDLPFVYKSDLYNKSLKIRLFYGFKDTINSKSLNIKVTKFYEQSAITGFIVGSLNNNGVIIALGFAILLIAVIILIWRKRKSNKNHF